MKSYDEVSLESLLMLFDKNNQITWPELLNLVYFREASIFRKAALAEVVEILLKEKWIERVKGESVEWKITEAGRYKFINRYIRSKDGKQSFGLLGQTSN